MSTKELTKAAVSLPLAERIALAQTLWDSIGQQSKGSIAEETCWAVEEADRRDAEMSAGKARVASHDEVMRAARRAIE